MNKIVQLDPFFPTGEPTVFSVIQPLKNGRFSLEKTALARSKSPALDYISGYQPVPNEVAIILNAFGSFETYGSNRNGDAFPAQPYKIGVPIPGRTKTDLDGWVNEKEIVTRHYQTFESGGVFEHHVNHDINRSLGTVKKAFWNHYMQRVELLVSVSQSKKPELCNRINSGDYPAVSMGCRVQWDVCTFCGNRAPTRKEYCDHLMFHMREISPEGIVYAALNPSPVFFDISFVIKPADETGYMMKKVAEHVLEVWTKSAELGENVDRFKQKQAEVRKIGDIQKEVVDGGIQYVLPSPEVKLYRKYRDTSLKKNVEELPWTNDKEISAMAEFPISDALSTAAKHGAYLTTSEVAQLWAKKANVHFSEYDLNRIVYAQPALIEACALYPDTLEKVASFFELSNQRVNQSFEKKLASWLKKRATLGEYLKQRWHEPSNTASGAFAGPGYLYNAQAPAKSDLLTMTDPQSGQEYRTTRGAAQTAEAQRHKRMLGTAALLGTAYTLGLGKLPEIGDIPGISGHALRGVLGGAAGLLTSRALFKNKSTPYQTDQGPNVPKNTEFVKSSTAFLNKLAADYYERLKVWPREKTLHQALHEKVAKMKLSKENIGNYLYPFEKKGHDSTTPPTLFVSDLTNIIGDLL